MLRALLLQAFYSIRSERQLVEQIDYTCCSAGFVGLGMDDAVWNPRRVLEEPGPAAQQRGGATVFAAVNKQAKRFMSDDHFTVDGT